jgi:hypothetical protein
MDANASHEFSSSYVTFWRLLFYQLTPRKVPTNLKILRFSPYLFVPVKASTPLLPRWQQARGRSLARMVSGRRKE